MIKIHHYLLLLFLLITSPLYTQEGVLQTTNTYLTGHSIPNKYLNVAFDLTQKSQDNCTNNIKLSKPTHPFSTIVEDQQFIHSKVQDHKNDLLPLAAKHELTIGKLRQTTNLLYGSIALGIVFILLTYIYYRFNRKLKTYHKNLINQSKELKDLLADSMLNERSIMHQIISLKESNKNLENFAYAAAHDIKTPIRTIGGFASLLKKRYINRIDEKDKYMFDLILSDSEKLSDLVDGLLGFSQLRKNLTKIDSINLNELVDTAFNQLTANIASRELVINKQIEPLPVLVTHYSLVLQLFLNLINNSIKFSKNNKNTISIGWRKKEETLLEFYLKDEGIGIPKAQQSQIFEMFSKYSKTGSQNSGNGIGLATCKRIVNYLGGHISVESREGSGTTFNFTIKVKPTLENTYEVVDTENELDLIN